MTESPRPLLSTVAHGAAFALGGYLFWLALGMLADRDDQDDESEDDDA